MTLISQLYESKRRNMLKTLKQVTSKANIQKIALHKQINRINKNYLKSVD